ncbi:MAG: CGNR zinc finger domain-containing protein [Acidobacteriota bacterium]|nr:CGNR zinc finger domain-containing protein [Acidobacteriota bacterium]
MADIVGHAEYEFDLSGGNLCLDFANTVNRRQDPDGATDHINCHGDLVSFAEQCELISPEQGNDLRAHAARERSRANRAFRKSLILRESLFRAFSAIAAGNSVEQPDLRRIEGAALEALRHRTLSGHRDNYQWEWKSEPGAKDQFDRILWPIAQSAAELLTSGKLDAVRQCEAATCAWLFLDESRNHSRRWCDMSICGNREKARRHYQRKHR